MKHNISIVIEDDYIFLCPRSMASVANDVLFDNDYIEIAFNWCWGLQWYRLSFDEVVDGGNF